MLVIVCWQYHREAEDKANFVKQCRLVYQNSVQLHLLSVEYVNDDCPKWRQNQLKYFAYWLGTTIALYDAHPPILFCRYSHEQPTWFLETNFLHEYSTLPRP